MQTTSRVYFLVPDHSVPSWGVGMILHLNRISRKMGVDAALVFQNKHTDLSWILMDLKRMHLEQLVNKVRSTDILIVPEVMTGIKIIQQLDCRKVIFIQNGFLIPDALGQARSFQELGYERALVVMKHLEKILIDFWPIPVSIVSPLVPAYFYSTSLGKIEDRKKQIILFPKEDYEKAGYHDFRIARKILDKWVENTPWKIIELKGLSHQKVSKLMKESRFFISTNCFESLNASVAESMAAGCVTFCYEAFGGQDYLRGGVNAYVYPNNYIYPLLKAVRSCMIAPNKVKLNEMRIRARDTVTAFDGRITKSELLLFWNEMKLIRD